MEGACETQRKEICTWIGRPFVDQCCCRAASVEVFGHYLEQLRCKRRPILVTDTSHLVKVSAPCALLTEHDVYAKLGSNRRDCQSAYRALFSHAMADDELAALRRATERGEPLGDETFIANATKALGRRVTKQAHGGDRKSFDFMTHAASNTLTP